ncbi:MAG: hypothetical protein HC902_01285, partial [Calothrix sp. SM1_5_4]|nr:hypothetical protein [Calothrix sp. SM1_5_4]
AAAAPAASPVAGAIEPSGAKPERLVAFASPTLKFDISSKGMGFKSIQLPAYRDRKGETVGFGFAENHQLPLETRLLGRAEALDFDIEKVNPNLYVGARGSEDWKLRRPWRSCRKSI